MTTSKNTLEKIHKEIGENEMLMQGFLFKFVVKKEGIR